MSKNKKGITVTRIFALITAVFLIGIMLLLTNSFVGNPVSKMLAEKAINRYIDMEYSDLNLQRGEIQYNFKMGNNYSMQVKSSTSVDTHFNIYCDSFGKVIRDDYDIEVENRNNTFLRINEKYSDYVVKFLKDNLEYNFNIIDAYISGINDDEMPRLELDKNYDVHDEELKGHIIVYVYTDEENLSWENVAKVTKEIDDVLTKDNLNIDKYTVVLETIIIGENATGNSIGVYDFDRELLSSENLPQVMLEQYEKSKEIKE